MYPEIRYASSGGVQIAYQVMGTGPFDLVWVPGFISNLDVYWEEPTLAHFMRRLSSFARFIVFDKRGTGLSDRVGSIPSLEERMDDVRAVMDAVDSRQAAILGTSEGGAMSMLFAATYPERTRALVLYGGYAHFHTWVLPADRLEGFIARIRQTWGTGASLSAFAPTKSSDETFKSWWARFERLGASPSAAVTLMRMNSEIDVRNVLPAIRVPALILHRLGDPRVNIESGRYLAAHIPGAKLVELPGGDHVMWAGDVDLLAEEMEEFLTGTRSELELERVLATILVTDVVNSTQLASQLGDQAWSALLQKHDALVRQELARFRGREVRTTGDGFLATFDGPARAVRCAAEITRRLPELGLEARSGLHTGEINVHDREIGGITVHIAARIAAHATAGAVLVSRTVRDLVAGSNLQFIDLGSHELKGVKEGVNLFALASSGGTSLLEATFPKDTRASLH